MICSYLQLTGYQLNRQLKDSLTQYYGILTALDAALIEGDEALADALWRFHPLYSYHSL